MFPDEIGFFLRREGGQPDPRRHAGFADAVGGVFHAAGEFRVRREPVPHRVLVAVVDLKDVRSPAGVTEARQIPLDGFLADVLIEIVPARIACELPALCRGDMQETEVFVENLVLFALEDHQVEHRVVPGEVVAAAVLFKPDEIVNRVKADNCETALLRK